MKMLENDDKKVVPRTGFEPATFRLAKFATKTAVKNIRGKVLQTTEDRNLRSADYLFHFGNHFVPSQQHSTEIQKTAVKMQPIAFLKSKKHQFQCNVKKFSCILIQLKNKDFIFI